MSRGIIDQDGNEQTWTAVYWRYHSQCEEERESLADAYRFLASGEDYGSLSADCILGPDGEVVMTGAQFSALYCGGNHDASDLETFITPQQRQIASS